MTLVEILVVIVIIGIIAAILTAATSAASANARLMATETTIRQLNGMLEDVVREAVVQAQNARVLDGQGTAGRSNDLVLAGDDYRRAAVITAKRSLIEQLPERFGEIDPVLGKLFSPNWGGVNLDLLTEDPYTRPANNSREIPPVDHAFASPLRTSYWSAVIDTICGTAADQSFVPGQNATIKRSLWMDGSPQAERISRHTPVTERAECLYLILSTAGAELDELDSGAIADTDGDGMLEFVDAWHRPIQFFRWPTHFESTLQPIVPPRDATGLKDELDPLSLLMNANWWSNTSLRNAFETRFHSLGWIGPNGGYTQRVYAPKFLILSYGPDGLSGLDASLDVDGDYNPDVTDAAGPDGIVGSLDDLAPPRSEAFVLRTWADLNRNGIQESGEGAAPIAGSGYADDNVHNQADTTQ